MMRLPVIRGLIKRRLLLNYRVDPEVIRAYLPTPFRPKLHAGSAIAGVCLIRLEQVRPVGFPVLLGISSENAAHRISVQWDDPSGGAREGVFIPQRHTGSWLNHLTGGRVFPGEHQLASFTVADEAGRIDFRMRSRDDAAAVHVRGFETDAWPSSSCFASLADSSRFFEQGSVGYSVISDSDRLDGIRLQTLRWSVRALEVESIGSTFFDDTTVFPIGSVEFDHALVMRDIPHEWHSIGEMRTQRSKERHAPSEDAVCC
jgi:hypothetical protein